MAFVEREEVGAVDAAICCRGLTGRIAYLKTGHKLEICIYT